jgi:hypothetical protein
MAFAFVGVSLVLIILAPVLVLALLSIWALPDLQNAPTRVLERFFFAYFTVAILWPSYISISIPHSGLPWVNPQRLIYTPMSVIFLICVSISKDARAQIAAVYRADRVIFWLMISFMVIITYSVALSDRVFFSMDKWADAEVSWGCMFFIACYLFAKPGRVMRWVRILWICAVIASLIALWEWRLKHVPWYGYLPEFLQMDPQMLKTIAPSIRNIGAGAYRVRSTFQDSIGLGEYMSLTVPFLFCFVSGPFSRWTRAGAALTVLLVSAVVVLSNARAAMIGVLIDFTLYGFYWGALQWRDRKESLIGPALVLSYPVLAVVGLAATFLIDRIRITLWVNGATQYSNIARQEQWTMGIPKVLSQPLGHGIDRAADILGFFTPSGGLTIDSYFLSVLLDYGIIGFIIFLLLILYSSFSAAHNAFKYSGDDREILFLPAASLALISFLTIKSVYSEPVNHPFYFMVMGMVAALVYRTKLGPAPSASQTQGAAMVGALVPRQARGPLPAGS